MKPTFLVEELDPPTPGTRGVLTAGVVDPDPGSSGDGGAGERIDAHEALWGATHEHAAALFT